MKPCEFHPTRQVGDPCGKPATRSVALMKYVEHDLKREVRELKGELARRLQDSLPVPPQGSYE